TRTCTAAWSIQSPKLPENHSDAVSAGESSAAGQSEGAGRLAVEITSADGERRLPPRRRGLYIDAVDPLDPPVAPPSWGHEAHGEPVIGREGSTAHLCGEQQALQV